MDSFMKSASISKSLDVVILQIVNLLNPEIIYFKELFFLILISNKSQRPVSDYKGLLDASGLTNNQFIYSVIIISEFQRQLDKGNLFYSSLCNKENVVYQLSHHENLLTQRQRLERNLYSCISEFTPGFKRAKLFVKGAAFYYEKEELPMAAFMLHQAIEQVFRALILSIKGQEVRTHSILELKQHLQTCAPELLYFLSPDCSTNRRLLDRIEKAYSCARYIDSYTIAKEDINTLFEEVKKLLGKTKRVFEEMVRSLNYDSIDLFTLNK
jgi:HEPN domain-containing protein